MTKKNLLEGKSILAVDDDADIVESIVDLLPMCRVTKALSFREAKELLERESFDLAVLDIMGVDGYDLLEIAKDKGVIALMLTAHALSVEDTARSFRQGAASFVPKDELVNIAVYLRDILEAKKKGKHYWWNWLKRLGPFYEKRFGPDWQGKESDVLEKLKYHV